MPEQNPEAPDGKQPEGNGPPARMPVDPIRNMISPEPLRPVDEPDRPTVSPRAAPAVAFAESARTLTTLLRILATAELLLGLALVVLGAFRGGRELTSLLAFVFGGIVQLFFATLTYTLARLVESGSVLLLRAAGARAAQAEADRQ